MRHLFPKSILGHINQIKMNINITAHVLIKKTPKKTPTNTRTGTKEIINKLFM